jgi:hypothetical protein
MITKVGIDLTPFCATESGRYALENPWRSGDVVYATDGRILIQVSVELCPDAVAPGGKVPNNCESLLSAMDKVLGWMPVPSVAHCDTCDDRCYTTKTCQECDGHGKHSCSCGDTHDCGKCGGTGEVESGLCKSCQQVVFGRVIQAKFLRMIGRLPNAKIGAAPTSPSEMIYFTFDGGKGSVMPCD